MTTDITSEPSTARLDIAGEPSVPASIAPRPADPVWRRALVRGALWYVYSRVLVLLGAGIVATQRAVRSNQEGFGRPRSAVRYMVDVLTSWDGRWYYEIVRKGYPRHVPPLVTYDDPQARAAFFPVYPSLLRGFNVIVPGSDVVAGLLLSFILGLTAVVAVGMLARRLYGAEVAGRAMVLTAIFPGAFVLSFTYSEGALITVSALALLALLDRRWVTAGLLAAVATGTRPNGVAVAVVCAVAALIAIKQRREWRALAAPLLAPWGFIGFQVYLAIHANESTPWFRVQREAWREGTSFGGTALHLVANFLLHPLASSTNLVTSVSIAATVGLCVVARLRRLPLLPTVYVGVVLFLMLLPATVTARPRFLFTAFPLLISAAALWRPSAPATPGAGTAVGRPAGEGDSWAIVITACSAGLVALTAMYGVLGVVP